MELLVILLGEFLFFPVLAALGSVVNLGVSFVSGLFLLIFEIFVPGGRIEKNKQTSPPSKRSSFPFKPIAKTAFFLCLIIVVFLVTVNTFFFSQTVNWVTSQVGKKTGTYISFQSVDGSFFSGGIKFGSLQVKRENSPKVDFDIFVKSLALDVDVKSLLKKSIILEYLKIDNIKGNIRQRNHESLEPEKDDSESGKRKIKTKTRFVVNDMFLKNIELKLDKEDMDPLVVSLSKIESRPFRSSYAIFDTFFRSTIEGSLNGHKISIASEEIGAGRKTTWHLDHLPVRIIHYFVQKAPVTWFKSGDIDIRVEDVWEYGDAAEIDMDWKLQLNHIVVKTPENTSLINKALAFPIVHYINTKGDKIDLQFKLAMNENQFESTASLDAAGLWRVLVERISENTAMMTGEKTEVVKDGIQNKIGDFKNFLKNKAKK
jgi:hypothetical protein